MSSGNYLFLRLTRLNAGETWTDYGSGLCFLFPRGGVGKFISGRNSERLLPGDVLVFNGESGGRLCVPERAEIVFWCFSVRPEHLFPLFDHNEIPLIDEISAQFKIPKHQPASSRIARECHRLMSEVPPQFDLDHRSQLLRVVSIVLSPAFKEVRRNRVGFVRIEEHLMQVFEKLTTDELLNLSVVELAKRFGCSRRHLNRLFHNYFGFSVTTLRMEMRLSKAVSLLRDPNAKVIRVAEGCGFNHLGLFNTCFRRRFGVSPGEWRKKSQIALSSPPAEGLAGAQDDCPMRISGLCPWTAKIDGPNGAKAPGATPAVDQTSVVDQDAVARRLSGEPQSNLCT